MVHEAWLSIQNWELLLIVISDKIFCAKSLLALFRVYFVGNKVKGRISKRRYQENKARQFFRKNNISYSDTHMCMYKGVTNVRFFGKFGVPCFLVAFVLRISLLPFYGRIGFPSVKTESNPRGQAFFRIFCKFV